MLDPALLERLRHAITGGPSLRLAMLFGSRARGTARPDSDFDIAVLPVDPDLSLSAELALQAQLSSALGGEVDLLRLDRCQPGVRWRVANEGITIVASPPSEESRFRARAGIEHAEDEATLRHAAQRFQRRLARGERNTAKSRPSEP